MGGVSRLRYHGVPRVIANTTPAHLKETLSPSEVKYQSHEEAGVEALARVAEVLGHDVRINVNVRQVLAPGQSFPKEVDMKSEAEISGSSVAPDGGEATTHPNEEGLHLRSQPGSESLSKKPRLEQSE